MSSKAKSISLDAPFQLVQIGLDNLAAFSKIFSHLSVSNPNSSVPVEVEHVNSWVWLLDG
jgi:hypothetical protein